MSPARGEVWLCQLDPTLGHEQAGRRPVAVMSADQFNRGPSELVVVVPLTTRDRGIPLHVGVRPPEGGVAHESFLMPEMIRSVSQQRLVHRLGSLGPGTLADLEDRIRVLLVL